MLYYVIFILIAGSICLVTLSMIQLQEHPRLMHLTRPTPASRISKRVMKILKPLFAVTRPFTRLKYINELQRQAEVLRINLDVSILILIKVFLAALLGVAVFIFWEPTYSLAALLVAFFLPDFYMRHKIMAKKEAISRVFPETVDLLDMCISSGADFIFSVKWVIDKCDPNPFIEQLGIVLSEIQIGKTRTDALKDMAKRLKIPDISSFVRTIIQSERMGTSIEAAFGNLSDDTRNMRFQAGERYAIKSSIKILFPLIFCILPTILIVVAGPILIKFSEGQLIPQGVGF
jgi:tight adherence protein C